MRESPCNPAQRNRFCGYCGKTLYLTLLDFIKHINPCEKNRAIGEELC